MASTRSSGALTADAVVRDGAIVVLGGQFYEARKAKKAKAWGDGCALVVRIEPEDEAWRHSDAKHLYGHLYTPVSKRTGETVAEVHLRMKAEYFPDDGRTSLTQLSREEMKSYIESVEQDIREHDSDSWEDCLAAMALYEEKAGSNKKGPTR